MTFTPQHLNLHLTLCLLVLFTLTVTAQESTQDSTVYKQFHKFPLLTLDHFNYPKTSFNTDTDRGEMEINEQRLTMQIAFPLKEKKTYLFNSINYTLFNYHTTFDQSALDIQESYHSIQLSIGLISVLPKRWRLVFNAMPTIASDFHRRLNSDDFIFQVSAMATKRASQNFQYGFGLAYTSRFGNLTIIPLVSLTYKKEKWLTSVILPAYASQYYVFNDKYRLGFKAAVYGNLYNVHFDDIISALDLNRLSYSRITLGPEFQFKLIGDLYVNTGGGIAVRNVFQVQDDDLNTELDLDVKSRAYLNVGLRILK
ncbi:DUF6268 family outer membrane beta-barrel protein [Mangrovimonas sp. TPBH4]|uniref:DUF6268 family outer membrane beta-barrel protein n=1 Tax=Mangrovimonas sp. TPBH4 TaxID=1645914 RepID=UPI0006B53CB5|nr:DUF6268 family outer membrane beta-barrel protein [Mangrovimonas sp. TPBH4]